VFLSVGIHSESRSWTEAGSESDLPLGRFFPDRNAPQTPADVAVVIPTILRDEIVDAVDCIYRQELGGRRVQIVIGVDINADKAERLYRKLETRPEHVSALVLTLPYSTAQRHGGLHRAADGGALRTILSFMANARYVAYLDDDNTWEPDHLARLLEVIPGKGWAFSKRLLVAEESGEALADDRWDSVGPDRGRMASLGGFVDPSCLMIDKLHAAPFLWLWSDPLTESGREGDRRFFKSLVRLPHAASEAVSVRYKVRESNVLREFIRTSATFD
jgi:hypothetical protein